MAIPEVAPFTQLKEWTGREQHIPHACSFVVPLGGFEPFAALCRARRFDDLGEIRIEAL